MLQGKVEDGDAGCDAAAQVRINSTSSAASVA